ncbi:MAG: potassium-transporting ATPase subunit KdpA [Alphaproteobacteria bacterium]|nr:potassium-transporting ATPase subunit KdpA [Alphaproteobacteria bacterium]
MNFVGWAQIALYCALIVASVKPLGALMHRVFEGDRVAGLAALGRVERGIYRLAGIDPAREQSWTAYAIALLIFNAVGFLALYALLRLQGMLPLNPQSLAAVGPDLAFNAAMSFVTNTNWQSYGGESTMSHLSQMAGLAVQNFVSAATGIAVLLAMVRGFVRAESKTLGNFWVDLVRGTLYVLLPLSLLVAAVLAATGVPQTLEGALAAKTLEGANQTIPLGPVASQLAIKQLGTNGGGFFNANSAHPLENPNGWSNIAQLWAILAIPAALTFTFGRLVGSTRQGWTLFAAMGVIFLGGVIACYAAEAAGNPILAALGVDAAPGNLEGKESRFGVSLSALWAVATTAASNGSVNAMHDSFTPLGGMVPMIMIQLGEIVFGGVGSGLYGMLVYALLAVFLAGLMVGRTPEYLGKKIESREVKLASLFILVPPIFILGVTAASAVLPSALASLNNAGPHGFSELLYAASSAVGNNGSAFAGLNANTPFWNDVLGLAMLVGRYAMIVPVMAIAGSLGGKKRVPASDGTFPTDGPLFVVLLVGTILVVGGLTFLPALSLGPIVEHLLLLAGRNF